MKDVLDKQVFRNDVEYAISQKLHVSVADCLRAGIPMPTQTRIVRVTTKPKPPVAKTPVKGKKPATKAPAKRTALRAR